MQRDAGYVFVNGRHCPRETAAVSVFDHGFLYGDGVFETIIAWNGIIYRLEDHLDRLFRSMQVLQIAPPYDREQLTSIICELIRLNGLRNAYVKLIITRGSNGTPLMNPAGCVPGVVCLAVDYAPRPALEQGIRVKTASIRRPGADVLDPHVKSLNYLNLVLARLEARAASVDEALLLDTRGRVCEAPGYNVFVVQGGALATPVDDILAGITRLTVLEAAARNGIAVTERKVELYDAYTADEIIFCSTAAGIVPVIELDGRMIGDGQPGPMYHLLSDDYRRQLEEGNGVDAYA
jgi:branched-chain amino acid aminotransferase